MIHEVNFVDIQKITSNPQNRQSIGDFLPRQLDEAIFSVPIRILGKSRLNAINSELYVADNWRSCGFVVRPDVGQEPPTIGVGSLFLHEMIPFGHPYTACQERVTSD
jgi:hypothetical protein